MRRPRPILIKYNHIVGHDGCAVLCRARDKGLQPRRMHDVVTIHDREPSPLGH